MTREAHKQLIATIANAEHYKLRKDRFSYDYEGKNHSFASLVEMSLKRFFARLTVETMKMNIASGTFTNYAYELGFNGKLSDLIIE